MNPNIAADNGNGPAFDSMPVVRELPADLETPVAIYLKLADTGPSFMLESVTGGEQIARYSFIGVQPGQVFTLRGSLLEHFTPRGTTTHRLPEGSCLLDILCKELSLYRSKAVPGMPRFTGGLVGYLGYDLVHSFEPLVPVGKWRSYPDSLEIPEDELPPDAIFLLADTLIVYDHAFGRILLIANLTGRGDPCAAREEAGARLDELERRLSLPVLSQPPLEGRHDALPLSSNVWPEAFFHSVLEAKRAIASGEISQLILSQRFWRFSSAAPFSIYRALRRINPSPYMFYFDFGRLSGGEPVRLMGASPEMHVRLDDGQATLRPVAGARPRGESPAEEKFLQNDLLNDAVERASHFSLVDLARNDLGRVCEPRSLAVPDFLRVERYAHDMHIVSRVEGRLKEGLDCFDLMKATFPAGAGVGVPKLRAMQLIASLESEPRGPFAGSVGYFSFDGNMDTCIAIRTLMTQGKTVSIHSGASITATTTPERAYAQMIDKVEALNHAVEMAELKAAS